MMPLIIMRARTKPVIDWSFLGSMPSGLTFARVGSAMRFDSFGVMQSAAANEPRFDHAPLTGEPLGLLLEGPRANVFLNSETPQTQSIAVTAQAYTLSFYGTGSIVRSGVSSGTTNGVGAYPVRTRVTFTPAAGALTLTVSGDVQKCQLEAGAAASSYIPTNGVAATRLAESLYTTNLPWFNQASGCFLVDLAVSALPVGNSGYYASFDAGATTSYLFQGLSTSNTLLALMSGSKASGQTIGGVTFDVPFKSAFSYTAGKNAFAAKGLLDGDGTLRAAPLGAALLRLNFGNVSAGNRPIDIRLRRFRYWNRRLSDEEIKRITT